MKRSRSSVHVRGMLCGAMIVAAILLLAVGPASATPASFTSSGWGFEPTSLVGLPTGSIGEEDPFLLAGAPGTDPNLDVVLSGSTDLCVLAAGSSVCQLTPSGLTGAYSALVTLQVSVLNTAMLPGPFTLLLTGLGNTDYDPSEVSVELDPMVDPSLDTSAVPNFVYGGAFTPFVHIRDLAAAQSHEIIYDYIGWTVEDGDSVTFRYDVSVGPNGRQAPVFTLNATPIIVPVPEPGTALLMGLGLAGLSFSGARRAAGRTGRANEERE